MQPLSIVLCSLAGWIDFKDPHAISTGFRCHNQHHNAKLTLTCSSIMCYAGERVVQTKSA